MNSTCKQAPGIGSYNTSVQPKSALTRYNHRKMNDGDRFNIVVREIVGKRLTWDQLTGKEGENAEAF